ncbi:hypothetical protein SLE2022_153150 [Rubroshorea leprosula]
MAADHKRKRKRRLTESKPNKLPVTIPLDLISEILVRLPAEGLLRFRSVSKHFRSLLTDPEFVHKHATQANENAEHQRLLSVWNTFKPLYKINLETATASMSSNALKELHWWSSDVGSNEAIIFVGSCNGLVCVSKQENPHNYYSIPNLWLFNPLTRESYKVPPSGPYRQRGPWFRGFGFDPTTKDYKIVRIKRGGIEVFSLKTNTWKSGKIQEPCSLSYATPYPGHVAVVHGALHWDIGQVTTNIASFDLAQENLKDIMPPQSVVDGNIGVLQGHLCVSSVSLPTAMTCVWMMEEYGVTESWMKLYIIKLEHPNYCWRPICYTTKGEILFSKRSWKSRLRRYDPKDNKLRICRLPKGLPKAEWFWMGTYVETLISIKQLQGSN